jgi:NAD(P)H-dependent flavin oxidoreductase YrpB (nitropropane dioxygenase family)
VKDFFLSEYDRHIPVIAAGGIWDRKDVMHALAEGADAVQMASRFVATVECDAAENFKQAYIDCRKEDIGLIMSPAGLPGRAIIKNKLKLFAFDEINGTVCATGCLKKCTYKESRERFCIVKALDRAQRGDVETGIVFCGTNAYKAERIVTVQEIFTELFAQEAVEEAA